MKTICFLSLLALNMVLCAATNANVKVVAASYVVDSSSRYAMATIYKQHFTLFNATNTIDIGYNKNAIVWCKFILKNTSSTAASNSYLCFNNNHLDSVELYTVGGINSILLGDRTRGTSPFIQSIAFPIVLAPNQHSIVFARIKKVTSYLDFNFSIAQQSELAQQNKIETVTISFVTGMVFLLLLLNTILFFASKKKLYLHYILYSLLSTLYILITSNYLKHCLFPNYLYFSEIRIYVASISFVSLNVFIMHYLNLKTINKNLYTTIQWFNKITLLLVILSLLLLFIKKLEPLRIIQLVAYIMYLSVYTMLIYATYKCLVTNKKAAINVLLFFSPVIIWSISFLLKILAILPYNIHHNFLIYTIMYEVLLFGFVLSKEYVAVLLNNNALIKKNIAQKEKSIQAITQAQIKERATIANIIHDNFGSKLAYINQQLQLNKIAMATAEINNLAIEMRNVSHQILPQALADGALMASITSHVSNINSNFSHKKVEVFGYDFPSKINTPWLHDIYLITLELISNALKHGKATHVAVELYHYTDSYLFQYTDNGVGFPNNAITKGFGLSTAQQRIENYKGTMEINTSANTGVVIQIHIPK